MSSPDSPERPDAPEDGPDADYRARGRTGKAPSMSGDPGHSVLQAIQTRTGIPSKVLLSDEASDDGLSPVLASTPGQDEQLPEGRGGALVQRTISAGAVAADDDGSPAEPTPSVTIDTETDDPTDDLDNITVALFQDVRRQYDEPGAP